MDRRGGFEVTEELVREVGAEAVKHMPTAYRYMGERVARDALQAVSRHLAAQAEKQAPKPERVPGPFVLEKDEEDAFVEANQLLRTSHKVLDKDELLRVISLLVDAVGRALRTLGPAEREQERIARLSEQVAEARAELEKLRKRTSEPDGDRLSPDQRLYVSELESRTTREWDVRQLLDIVHKLAPKPAHAETLEQVIAEMEDTGHVQVADWVMREREYWAGRLKAAMRAKEGGNG